MPKGGYVFPPFFLPCMHFDAGTFCCWGRRGSLNIPDFSPSELAAKVVGELSAKLIPLVGAIRSCADLLKFLSNPDMKASPYIQMGDYYRAAQIAFLPSQTRNPARGDANHLARLREGNPQRHRYERFTPGKLYRADTRRRRTRRSPKTRAEQTSRRSARRDGGIARSTESGRWARARSSRGDYAAPAALSPNERAHALTKIQPGQSGWAGDSDGSLSGAPVERDATSSHRQSSFGLAYQSKTRRYFASQSLVEVAESAFFAAATTGGVASSPAT